MPFSPKLQPGFDLCSVPSGRGLRARRSGVRRRSRARKSAIALSIAGWLAAVIPWVAHAGPSSVTRRAPASVTQIAPAAVSGTVPGVLADPAAGDSASRLANEGAIAGPARARRRTPRPAAEIRAEARAPAARVAAPVPPHDLADLNGWLEYKTRAHVLALPVEARLFYRRGRLAHSSGKREAGERWARERVVFLLLTLGFAAIPGTAAVLERLTTPLDAERAPLYGVALLENEPWSSARQQRLASLVAREPANPFLHFALGWTARRG